MTDYYISPNAGSDAGAGTSGDPFQTIAAVQAIGGGGDTIYFGDSAEAVWVSTVTAASFATPPTFNTPMNIRGWGEGGSGQVLNGPAGATTIPCGSISGNNTLSNLLNSTAVNLYRMRLHETTGFIIDGHTNCSFLECEFADGGSELIDGSISNTWESCYFHNFSGKVTGGTGTIIVKGCYFKPAASNTTDTFDANGLSCHFAHCIFDGTNSPTGKAIDANNDTNKIHNCTFYNYGQGASLASAAEIAEIYNCVFKDCTTAVNLGGGCVGNVVGFNSLDGNGTDYNVSGAIGLDLRGNDSTASVTFADTANGDFTPASFVDGMATDYPFTSNAKKMGAVQPGATAGATIYIPTRQSVGLLGR